MIAMISGYQRGSVAVVPDGEPVVALERGPSGEQPEEQAAERVHVGRGVALAAHRLLGSGAGVVGRGVEVGDAAFDRVDGRGHEAGAG